MIKGSTITKKGQITLPIDMRRRLGLKPGERVNFVIKGHELVVSKDNYWEELDELRHANLAHVKKLGRAGLSIDEIKSRAEVAKIVQYREKHGL